MLDALRPDPAFARFAVIARLALVGACVPRGATPLPPMEAPRAQDPPPASSVGPSASELTLPLELTIATDRSSYAREDPVVLTVTLHNRGGRTISIAHPDYWGVSEIRLTDASGHPVAPESVKANRKPSASVMTIPPGERRSHAFEGLTFYTCCSADSFRGRLGPGRYRVVVTITSPPVRTKPPEGASDWTGAVVSAPASIEVR